MRWTRSRPRGIACSVLFGAFAVVGCDDSRANVSASADASPAMPVAVAPSASPSAAAAVPSASAAASARPAPEAVACQHVLVAFKGAKNAPAGIGRSKAEAKARAEEVRRKALAGEDMAELAKTYSDDPGSRDRLGSVGRFKREAMVKPFSDAAFALPVDGISDVVETPFGFHVLKRNQ